MPYIKHSLKRDFKEVTEKMEAEHEAKLARVGEEREQQLIVREAQITQLMDASGKCTNFANFANTGTNCDLRPLGL